MLNYWMGDVINHSINSGRVYSHWIRIPQDGMDDKETPPSFDHA